MSLYDQFLSEQGTISSGGLYQQFLDEQTPKPSYFQQAITGIKNYAISSYQQAKNYFFNPPSLLEQGKQVIEPGRQAFEQGTEAVGNIIQNVQQGTGNTVTDIADLAKLAGSVAGVLFSPISGGFNLAEHTPVLKQVADVIQVPFTLAGMAGAYATGQIVDFLPISKESKDILKKPIQELGSLVGQIVLGGKIMEKAGDFLKVKKDIKPEEAQTIVNQAKTEIPQENLAPPKTSFFEQYKTEVKPVETPEIKQEIAPGDRVIGTTKEGEKIIGRLTIEKEPPTRIGNKSYEIGVENPTIIADTGEKYRFGDLSGMITEMKKIETKPIEITPKEYPIVKNILPTIEPVAQFRNFTIKPKTKISELKVQISGMEEALKENPVRRLTKYANRNRELPEVLGGVHGGKGATSEFGIHGDSIAGELGFETSEDARNAYQKYIKSLDKVRKLKKELRNLKGETFVDYTPEQFDRINRLFQQAAEGTGILTPAESTGKILTSKLAAGVEANAIEKKLVRNLGDLPQYNRVNMKQQAQLALDLLTKNPEQALRIAMGEELPPHHILPEAVFTAVENRAIETGDVETLRKLATESSLSTQATAMGQRIRALGERYQDSPVGIIREIKEIRESKIPPKAKENIVNEIKDSIKKSTSRQTWEQFINEIKCNY